MGNAVAKEKGRAQMIDDAAAVDDRFKDKSYAIHQILIDTWSEAEAAKTEAKIDKRATRVHTYLNALHVMYPVYQVSKGNWLVGVKGDKELPPSPKLWDVWWKGCCIHVVRAAVIEEEAEKWEMVNRPDVSAT